MPDSAVFLRSFRKTFPTAVRGEGVYVWDAERQAIPGFLRFGRSELHRPRSPEIAAAMAEQAKQLEFVHTSQFTTPVAEDYARELLEFAGENSAEEPSTSPAAGQKRSKPRSN